MLKHHLTVAGEMFGVEDREFDVVFAEKIQQRLLALDLREAAEIAVTPEEIEGIVDDAGPAGLRRVRPAVRKSWCVPHGRPPPRRR